MSTDTAAMRSDPAVRPFHADIADETIVDLRRRIAAWRPPEREPVDDESQGVQLATVRDLANYWATEYDWRRCEAKLNTLPQFVTEIDGLDIHFIHVKSDQPNALPLIVSHGWPGSIIEQLKIIEPLTNPPNMAATRRTHSMWSFRRCRATGSPASPPCSVGLVSGWMIFSCSMTEPGQPCETISGSAFRCGDRTWMKWTSSPSMVVMNWSSAFSFASHLRQSYSVAQ